MDWFILAFISAVFSAVSAVSEKKSLFSLDAFDFTFLSSFVTLIFTLPFFFLAEYNAVTSASLSILIIKTLLGAASYLCIMLAMKNMEISQALPMLALSPGLVAIAGTFLLNDHLFPIEWIGVSLMVSGTYILELRKKNTDWLQPFKLLFSFSKYGYIFIALILFSISSLLDRLLLKEYNLPPFTFISLQQLLFVIIFLFVILIRKKGKIFPINNINKSILGIIIFVGICTVIYRYTQIEATRLAPAALVLSVKRLSVLLAIVLGGRLFSEGRLLTKAIAAIIILSGITILAVY